MMTVLETLAAATEYLQRHQVDSPRLNAEHLLAHTLSQKRLELYLQFDRPLTDAQRAPLRELVKQRAAGRPLQHLLGTSEFFGRSFLCDGRALIPRPETEQLVEFVLERKPFSRLLDVGTGSGVIAITLALELPDAQVEAIDLHPDALALAQENAARNNATVRFHQGDLLPPEDGKFDAIVANLPYIPTADMAGLQKEVHHDPASALDGGPAGLDLVERLAALAPARLNPGGLLALEIGHDQAPAVRELLAAHNYRDIVALRDYQEFERFVLASYG